MVPRNSTEEAFEKKRITDLVTSSKYLAQATESIQSDIAKIKEQFLNVDAFVQKEIPLINSKLRLQQEKMINYAHKTDMHALNETVKEFKAQYDAAIVTFVN